jgi:hypothetical protein
VYVAESAGGNRNLYYHCRRLRSHPSSLAVLSVLCPGGHINRHAFPGERAGYQAASRPHSRVCHLVYGSENLPHVAFGHHRPGLHLQDVTEEEHTCDTLRYNVEGGCALQQHRFPAPWLRSRHDHQVDLGRRSRRDRRYRSAAGQVVQPGYLLLVPAIRSGSVGVAIQSGGVGTAIRSGGVGAAIQSGGVGAAIQSGGVGVAMQSGGVGGPRRPGQCVRHNIFLARNIPDVSCEFGDIGQVAALARGPRICCPAMGEDQGLVAELHFVRGSSRGKPRGGCGDAARGAG